MVALPPSARVLGLLGGEPEVDGLHLGDSVFVVPANGDDAGVLILGSYGGAGSFGDLPATLVIPGALAPGDHEVRDVVVGGFADLYTPPGTVSLAGDDDSDGHTDVWLGGRLFHGPFDRTRTAADAVAYVTPTDRYATLGGVDVDGDGVDDVIVDTGRYVGYVFYGPFVGPIPAPGDPAYDPARVAVFAAGSLGLDWIMDHRGPGTMAFAVGHSGYDYEGTSVYDLPMAPGAIEDHGLTAYYGGGADWNYFMPVRGTGDLDGDGFGDAIVGEVPRSTEIALGPFEQIGGWWDVTPRLALLRGSADYPVGDVNGDGVTDLLMSCYEWRTLVLSPYDPVIDPCLGLPIRELADPDPAGIQYGDLDGDGLSDFVERVWSTAGGVEIWYGADILRAMELR